MANKNAAGIKIVYIGDDDRYLEDLKTEYKRKLRGRTLIFVNTYHAEDINHYNSFVDTMTTKPDIIYVDIAAPKKYMIRLAEFLRRQQALRGHPIVALLDDLDGLDECRKSNIKFIYSKCKEIHDIVYHPLVYRFPEIARSDIFAVGKTEFKMELHDEVKLGYIQPEYIKIEGMQNYPLGSILNFHHPLTKGITQSNKIRIEEVLDTDLYYSLDYGARIKLLYVDEPDYDVYSAQRQARLDNLNRKKSKMSKYNFKLEMNEFEKKYPPAEEIKEKLGKEIETCKRKLKNWVQSIRTTVNPRNTKILIVSPDLSHLRNNTVDFAELPFTISTQTILDKNYSKIYSMRPDVIVYSFPPLKEQLSNEAAIEKRKKIEKSESHEVFKNIQDLQAMSEYNPIVVFFQCYATDAKTMAFIYDYNSLITQATPITLKPIIDMGHMFDLRKKEEAMQELRYYFSSEECNASLSFTVTVTHLSESELMFWSEQQLNLGVFKVYEPIPLLITTVPIDDKPYKLEGRKFIYRGLLSGWDENLKKKIRVRVDKIFLKEKIRRDQMEKEMFEKKKKEEEEKRGKGS